MGRGGPAGATTETSLIRMLSIHCFVTVVSKVSVAPPLQVHIKASAI